MSIIKKILSVLLFCNITCTTNHAGNLPADNEVTVCNSVPTVDIILASKSTIKVATVQNIFNKYNVKIHTLEVDSGVNCQPVNEETFIGANNRIKNARTKYLLNHNNNKFIVIAIESGIFNEEKTTPNIWVDKAIVVIETASRKKFQSATNSITFLSRYVNIAKDKGFNNTTVGKVMAEMNAIKQHDDPHLSLAGKSRQQYLEDTLLKLANMLEQEQIIKRKEYREK